MRMLLTNDDGIHSPGLYFLLEVASEFGEVITVAPDRDRSGVGQAITLTRPLRLSKAPGHDNIYGLGGTPTDCVYVGLHHVMHEHRPDLVISGINTGANLGWDVHYSGTAAGAREGVLQGIPSAAFSLLPSRKGFPWEEVRPWLRRVFERITAEPPPEYTFYNVNIPNPHSVEIKGLRSTCLGHRNYSKEVVVRTDPRGRDYLWLGGSSIHMPDIPGSDCNAVKEGYVSITPLRCDATDETTLSHMGHWSADK